ncbi:MAG: cytochrome c family protein [Ignavibacteria bacterium]|mgnify:CR=1 FL=1|nr:cytochrome c family protein [Ignavibacteria bacterium]
MKYISYLLFFLFISALLYFLKNALEPHKEAIVITGSDKCGECHNLKNIGDQFTIWKNSEHSGAYTVLFSNKARDFASKNGLQAPEKEEKCLKCHSTAYSLKGMEKGESFNISEGVGCEACHGAGSGYSPAEIMRDEGLFIRNGGIKGEASTCSPCHNTKGSKEQVLKDDLCPFQEEDFDYKQEFEKIKHPLNKDLK